MERKRDKKRGRGGGGGGKRRRGREDKRGQLPLVSFRFLIRTSFGTLGFK